MLRFRKLNKGRLAPIFSKTYFEHFTFKCSLVSIFTIMVACYDLELGYNTVLIQIHVNQR